MNMETGVECGEAGVRSVSFVIRLIYKSVKLVNQANLSRLLSWLGV